jgi:hypothetical protein
MQEDTPRIKYTAEERRKLWGNEEVRKERQEWKAKKELFDKYVAKLNDDEKPPAPSKRKPPYYLRKDWLMERAATLLGLNKIMRKPASGFED